MLDHDIGKGDGMADGQPAIAPVGQVLELGQQAMLVAARLLERVLDGVLAGIPLAGWTVIDDTAALDLDHQHAAIGVGHDEIGLAVLRAAAQIARQPGDAVEDDIVVGQAVAQQLIELALSLALDICQRTRAGGIHAGHGSSVIGRR
ncbi:MAG: hypothetical protein V9H69_21145 [Anaerolineae bacterium]